MFTLTDISYKNILKQINLVIPSNKTICIIGRSGSGKSTLLCLFNKMLNYDAGSMKYHTKEIKEIDALELRKEVVMLSQKLVLFEGDIRQNLIAGQILTKRSISSDKTLHEMLQLVELDKDLHDTCTTLSGGEKQRLALARALLLQPKVLLLDEPTSGLDMTSETDIILNLCQYAKEHDISLIMITHSLQVIHHVDIVIELEAGQIKSVKEHPYE